MGAGIQLRLSDAERAKLFKLHELARQGLNELLCRDWPPKTSAMSMTTHLINSFYKQDTLLRQTASAIAAEQWGIRQKSGDRGYVKLGMGLGPVVLPLKHVVRVGASLVIAGCVYLDTGLELAHGTMERVVLEIEDNGTELHNKTKLTLFIKEELKKGSAIRKTPRKRHPWKSRET